MTQKDYYRILDVEREAGPKEIRESYRKLALKFHPDRNSNNPEAASRMKEINEAYAALSDPEKKSRYDNLRQTYGSSAYDHFRNTYSEQDIFKGSDVRQIFEEISRAFGFRSFDDVFGEAYGPGYRSFDFKRPGGFGKVFTGVYGGKGRASAPLHGLSGRLIKYALRKKWGIELPERGKDLFDLITISPTLALRGGKISYTNKSERKKLIVTVPPAIRVGQKIRLKGMGGPGRGGGESGDLFLKIRVRNILLQKVKTFMDRLWAFFSVKSS
ncbi:MAG: DnaJ domain-containing protein [Desulfatiglandaceae bacterium]|jgi:DnaJ-class molecular chaperone